MAENHETLVKMAIINQAKPNLSSSSSRKPKAKSGKNKTSLRRLLRRTFPSPLLDHLVEDHPLVDLVLEVEVLAPPVEEPPPLGNTEIYSPLEEIIPECPGYNSRIFLVP